GYMPFVWYNGYQISEDDISTLYLYYKGMIPCLRMRFNDSGGMLRDKGMPLDDTKIKLYLNPKSEKLDPIFIEFKITNISTISNQFVLYGILNVPDLYVTHYKSYQK